MRSWIEDEVDFAGAGAALGVAAGVLAVANSSSWAWLCLVPATLLVVVRALWRSMPPWLLLAGTAAPVLATEAADVGKDGWFLVCVALVVSGAARPTRLTLALMGAIVVAPFWLWVGRIDDYVEMGPWTWMMGLGLSALFGVTAGRQRDLIGHLESSQKRLAEAAADNERRRIARELHDVVGHSFSVVLLHLSGARRMLDSDPARAREALAEAEGVGRRSMNDLRAALTLLRDDDDSSDPVHGYEALPRLVDGFRQAGMDVSLTTSGDPDAVDPAAGVVLYGVAREALTNAVKHGTSGPVSIDVSLSGTAEMHIRNPVPRGTVVNGAASGIGLTGMSERLQAVGGRLDVDCGNGVWAVSAYLPVHSAADA
ncbi:MAG: histidine kinase [Acidimicrobiales bacterium]